MNGPTVQAHARAVRRARPPVAARQLAPLGRAECLALLAGAPLGRVVFTEGALPAIRPVNHVLVDGAVILRTHEGAALAAAVDTPGVPGPVVAYEADAIDPDTHLGWSVVVTGYAELVTDPAQVRRYEGLLNPWVDADMHQVIRIRPELVTGFRLTDGL